MLHPAERVMNLMGVEIMAGQRECLVETIKHQPLSKLCVWGVADTVKEKEKNNLDFGTRSGHNWTRGWS